MSGLLSILRNAEKQHKAIGHFNVANLEMLKAVSHVAERMQIPVVIGTSEGERSYCGPEHIVDMVQSQNKQYATGKGYRLFINADHTRSLDGVREAALAGYDAIVFDGSHLSFEDNIKQTAEAVQLAKEINLDIVMEGELGYIGSSSKILDALPEGAVVQEEELPSPEMARQFVSETGVDLLAPAVGNIHGMLREGANPHLYINHIAALRSAAGVPLVLHGGSGIPVEDIQEAIKAGMPLVHISTLLRRTWRESLEWALQEYPDEIAPYKLMPPVITALEQVITTQLVLLQNP